MIELFESVEDHYKAVSALANLEVRSAIRRRQHTGDTPVAAAESALSALSAERRRLVEHPITAQVLDEASAVIDRQNLRALDALQLATALIATRALTHDDVLYFVVSDQRLMTAAIAEGIRGWDPSTGGPP